MNMKKNYIAPASAEKLINPSQLICLSIGGDGEKADKDGTVLSKDRDDDNTDEGLW